MLSIIIVNYNVKYYLEHCLRSALIASQNCDTEIIVIDNASTDGSRELIPALFPDIRYEYQNENLGFSKANNLGIELSSGEYILLLNPDTVVPEDCFTTCLSFMNEHPDCGGLGVKMIDGKGTFLPESKRGLPTPSAAFYKMSGLARLFPKSKTIGRYHVGYLDKDETHEIEILSGAFMMMRKEALDKTGLLDENFFMYGEDIDLSYRLLKAGYKNYYLSDTSIIHYKGESTKKGSVNYVFIFYRAMIIFAKKHFERGQASILGFFINLAIYLRAGIAIARRLLGKLWKPLLSFAVLYLSFLVVKDWYSTYAEKDFDLPFALPIIGVYSLIGVATLFYAGGYDSPRTILRTLKAWLLAFVVLLTFYSLLPEGYRFSRAVIVIGAAVAFALDFGIQSILSRTIDYSLRIPSRILILGSEQSLKEARTLITNSGITSDFTAGVAIEQSQIYPIDFVGSESQIDSIIKDFRIDTLIIDTTESGYKRALSILSKLEDGVTNVFLMPSKDQMLVGKHKVLRKLEFESLSMLASLNSDRILRLKRSFDIVTAILCLATLPISIWFIDRKAGFISNCLSVLFGSRTWVGYDVRGMHQDLPDIKSGVVCSMQHIIWPDNFRKLAIKENVEYLVRYSLMLDLRIFLRHFHALGH